MSHVISGPSGCCSLGTRPRLFVISSAPLLFIFYLFCLFFPSLSSQLALLHHSSGSGLCSVLIVFPIRLPWAPLTQVFFFPLHGTVTVHSTFLIYIIYFSCFSLSRATGGQRQCPGHLDSLITKSDSESANTKCLLIEILMILKILAFYMGQKPEDEAAAANIKFFDGTPVICFGVIWESVCWPYGRTRNAIGLW